jgi:hypothetical protein
MSVVRITYINAFDFKNTGNVMLWAGLECGIGTIAGTLPMLRLFFKDLRMIGDMGAPNPSTVVAPDLVTIGRIKGRQDSTVQGCIAIHGYDDDETQLVDKETGTGW